MARLPDKSFERETLLPTAAFGFDSLQGYLEMAKWYHEGHVRFGCDIEDRNHFHSLYARLLQLEKEGYLALAWSPRETEDGREMVNLEQVSLTVSGHKLLAELQAKSRAGKFKEKLTTMFWAAATAAATSLATTLVVLAVKVPKG
jgi:hypothetical protein